MNPPEAVPETTATAETAATTGPSTGPRSGTRSGTSPGPGSGASPCPGSGPGIVRAGQFTRHAALAFVAGVLMGAVYWALSVPSPAPPLLGLTGLAGIVAGERIVTAVRNRPSRRRPASSEADSPGPRPAPSSATSQEPPHDRA
ncbi:XapX domain-containing protein [Streptomyces sp. SD11]|uniref:XapX domain-containing protein n=1 Tax=Streptomyces sp. SD11 TaxID=3452209 RepID=UPI003F8C471D